MASPDPSLLLLKDMDQLSTPSNLQLPDPVLSSKLSSASLQTSPPFLNGQTAMQEALSNSNKTNLMRRLSNKIKARRPSSAHPNSRDGSIGPGILRRRSDSNNGPPPPPYEMLGQAVDSDSDCDNLDTADQFSLLTLDGAGTEMSPTSAPASIAGSTGPAAAPGGPVIPHSLVNGTPMRKVSRKNGGKPIVLVLEPESAKITWDKTRTSKWIYIDDIKDIRTAEDTKQYRLDFGVPESDESRFFTIMYTTQDRSQTKLMHLIAEDDESFAHWTTTLDAISKHRQELMASLMAFNDKAVRAYWDREMAKQHADRPAAVGDEQIDFAGVERICRNLHIHAPQGHLLETFQSADVTRSGSLDFGEFQEFVRLMKRRDDIRLVYESVASDPEKGITRDEFLSFLCDVQGERMECGEKNEWDAVFGRFTRRVRPGSADAADEAPRMSEAALATFLTSTFNLSIAQEPPEYALDRPMNEYFISSSHNTYLLGRQVVGISSVEGYISALMRGCRCVEIDCWDGPDGQPTVVHGMTWTTKISFREVINTINKYAFVKSRFPLWISLEVHCNPEQQRIMARIMREVFGSKLVTETLPGCTDQFPSPSQLMDRILIKAKKPHKAEEPAAAAAAEIRGRRRGHSLSSPYVRPVALDSSSVPPQQSLGNNSPLLSPSLSTRMGGGARSRFVNTISEGKIPETPSSSPSDSDSGSERGNPGRKKQSKIVPELGELAVYCVGLKFHSFEDPDCKMFNHILSFVESTFDRNNRTRDLKRAMYRHNMRYLMRVYPNQMRIASTNMNPLSCWRKGVQMAALNWQTYDLGMQINQAMFDGGTDQSGYVLKPREFREFQVLPGQWEGKRERKNVSFTIDVVSAQQLMRPFNFAEKRSLDPFVEVEVFVPDERKPKPQNGARPEQLPPPMPLVYRTAIVRENGFNPVFNQPCRFELTTKYPDLVFVRWSVKLATENGKYNNANTMATFTAKLNSLKEGYRTIPLFDNNADQYLFSTLFCRISKDPITSVYVDFPDDALESSGGKLKKRSWIRSSNLSPKSSMEGRPA